MKTATKIFIVITLCFSFVGMVKADSGPISTQTSFHFQQNAQPITSPVNFDIKCYGTSVMSSDKLLKISELSKTCQSYGCQFATTNVFEVYKGNIQYCNLDGETNGNKFTVNDFLAPSMKGLNCHRADFDIETNNKYYKETQQYKDCWNAVHNEYYPDGNFICEKSEVEVPQSECAGYGYIIRNGICYKFTAETNACIAGEEQKQNLCNQYLQDVSAILAKDKSGYPFEQICEAKINVPASVSNNQTPQNQNTKPTLPVEQIQSKNIFSRIIDFFKCSFLKLFGKSC